MTLTTLAKISAAYLGLAVTFASASALWETGQDFASRDGAFRATVFGQVADGSR